MNLRIRMTYSANDGLVFALCKAGSWKPIALFTSRAEAIEALS
jgi:hypothetical protein